MEDLSQKEKLERYNEALTALPVREQIRKVEAIKSDVNLRRFVSIDAPRMLASRFAGRIFEMLGDKFDDLSNTEYGRVMALNHWFDEAFFHLNFAIKEKEPFAMYEMGKLLMVKGLHKEAIPFFIDSVENNVNRENSLVMLGVIMQTLGKRAEAQKFYDLATICGDGKQSDLLNGMKMILDGRDAHGESELLKALRNGDDTAGYLLLERLKKRGEAAGMKTVLSEMVKIGQVNMYLPLAWLLDELGDTEGAMACYKNAVTLRVQGADKQLVEYAVDKDKTQEAADFLATRLQDGNNVSLVNALALLYVYMGRLSEALLCCDRLFRSGQTDSAQYLLAEMLADNSYALFKQMIADCAMGQVYSDALITAMYDSMPDGDDAENIRNAAN